MCRFKNLKWDRTRMLMPRAAILPEFALGSYSPTVARPLG